MKAVAVETSERSILINIHHPFLTEKTNCQSQEEKTPSSAGGKSLATKDTLRGGVV